jgi:hypothetical protein
MSRRSKGCPEDSFLQTLTTAEDHALTTVKGRFLHCDAYEHIIKALTESEGLHPSGPPIRLLDLQSLSFSTA